MVWLRGWGRGVKCCVYENIAQLGTQHYRVVCRARSSNQINIYSSQICTCTHVLYPWQNAKGFFTWCYYNLSWWVYVTLYNSCERHLKISFKKIPTFARIQCQRPWPPAWKYCSSTLRSPSHSQYQFRNLQVTFFFQLNDRTIWHAQLVARGQHTRLGSSTRCFTEQQCPKQQHERSFFGNGGIGFKFCIAQSISG